MNSNGFVEAGFKDCPKVISDWLKSMGNLIGYLENQSKLSEMIKTIESQGAEILAKYIGKLLSAWSL